MRNLLAHLPLSVKIGSLLLTACILFISNIFATTYSLSLHFILMAIIISFFVSVAYLTLELATFKSMLKLWLLGTLVYACFAIPRIYLAGSLSPYYSLQSISDRWLYSFLLPIILLGTLSVGLIFVRITSPLEFLRWGKVGLGITLLLRALQHSVQIFSETRIALMMQNQWPEEKSNFYSLSSTWQVIKFSPLLIRTAIRNLILYWFPWGWICFNQLRNKQVLTQQKVTRD